MAKSVVGMKEQCVRKTNAEGIDLLRCRPFAADETLNSSVVLGWRFLHRRTADQSETDGEQAQPPEAAVCIRVRCKSHGFLVMILYDAMALPSAAVRVVADGNLTAVDVDFLRRLEVLVTGGGRWSFDSRVRTVVRGIVRRKQIADAAEKVFRARAHLIH